MATAVRAPNSLTTLERVLLVIPAAAGLVLGLGPLLMPEFVAHLLGLTGHDPLIYRLTGAATLGYAVALTFAVLRGTWRAARLPVIATLVLFAISPFSEIEALGSGPSTLHITLILTYISILIVPITAVLIGRHRGEARPSPDNPPWLVWFLVLATLISLPFALLPLFAPATFASLFGLQGTDVFIFREGGAAVFGYAVLGAFELDSRSWSEIFSAALMVLTFNGLVAVVCALVLLGVLPDPGGTLAPVALVASGFVALATAVEIARGGT